MRKCVFILLFGLFIFTCGVLTFGSTGENVEENKVYYECVEINYGDSLWKISEEYKTDNITIKDYIKEIKKINNLSTDNIKEGERILIPIYSS